MLNFAKFAQVMFGLRQMELVSASVPVLSLAVCQSGGRLCPVQGPGTTEWWPWC